MNELHWLGVVELAQAIAAKEVSPVEVVQALLARIDRLDGKLKSFITVFADSALEAAQQAAAAVVKGGPLGPLHGVPVALKDLYDVQGSPTTGGWKFPAEPARRDCTVTARLRAAGALILGKLNLHPFAYGPEGINPHFGSSWNPWDPTAHRMAGGSSSGSGVAVAAGLVPMGMGSDTGGSIRIPAACCGTVGLKPTYGRVSRQGILPLSWSLDHAGPLTRNTADAAAILAAIAGHDPAEPTSSTLPVPDYLQSLTKPVRGLRVGVLFAALEQADPEVQNALSSAVQVLQALGCTMQEVALHTAAYSLGTAYAILAPEAMAYHDPLLRRRGAEYPTDVRRRLLAGRFVSGTDYVKGQRARHLIRQEVNALLEEVDCLLLPTLPMAAPAIDASEVQLGTRTENVRLALTHYTRLFNVSGHPALAVPCGFSQSGLPLSLQLVGRAFGEATILRVGHAYEQAAGWYQQRPPLAASVST